LVIIAQRVDFRLAQILDIDQAVARTLQCRHDLVELEMDRQRIFVLRTLNQEDHQKSHDRRSGIDHDLPCVRVINEWPADGPDDTEQNSELKVYSRSLGFRRLMRKLLEKFTQFVSVSLHG